MIRVYIDETTEQPVVSFGGSTFHDVLQKVKQLGYTYIPENKHWTAHPRKVLNTLVDLRDVDDIEIDTLTMDELEEQARHVRGVRYFRNKVDSSLLKLPPIKGKSPNEDYQLHDLKKVIQTNRKGIFWEMGLGKTFLMVNVMNHFFAQDRVEKFLIIAPSEGIVNWTREIQKFSDLFPAERIIIGDRDEREPFCEDYDVVVMTYRTFLMISDDYYKRSTNGKGRAKKYRKPVIPFSHWGKDGKRMIILDEAQAIRNASRTTHVLNLHKEFFEYRYLLTGTPADKVEHYYRLMRFLDEDIIPESFNQWIQTIASVGDNFSKYNVNYYYPEKVEKFVEEISPFVIRRKTEEHVDLPENYIEKIFVRLEGRHRDVYRSLIGEAIYETQEKSDLTPKAMINQFPYLILALDNPEILKDSKAEINSSELRVLLNRWKFRDHCKLPVTESLVSRYIGEDHKVIVWSGHPTTIDQLAQHFSKYKPFQIHGQMDFGGQTRDKFRDSMVEEFKRSQDRHLLIASYKVLNSAVNLTEASRNVYFDRSYSLTEWLQSQKRTHRIGQQKRVITNPIILEDTLDLRLDYRLESKEDIDKKLLERNSLSLEEWKAIFKGDVTI